MKRYIIVLLVFMFSGCSISTGYRENNLETNVSEQRKVRKKASVQKRVEPKREAFSEKKKFNPKTECSKKKETPTVKKATEKDVLDFFDL